MNCVLIASQRAGCSARCTTVLKALPMTFMAAPRLSSLPLGAPVAALLAFVAHHAGLRGSPSPTSLRTADLLQAASSPQKDSGKFL